MGQQKTLNRDAIQLTQGPKHHLFGFHDLIISNKNNSRYLCLEADIINRPPLADEKFGVGYVEGNEFVKVGETVAMNYPQGSRQQWISDSNLFTVNNRVGDVWGTDIYDTDSKSLVDRLDSTCHMLTRDGRYALGLDYARLHRLGGYGYIGIKDKGCNDPMPMDSGITITELKTKETKILVSVRQVAECGVSNLTGRTHHYLTHLCLNPSSTRVAFLHRYFMPDGGLMTRLMTIGLDGSGLRCLGQGFLSHFDWKDDSHIYIFGRSGAAIDSIRNNPVLQNPLIMHTLRLSKKIIKMIIGKNKGIGGGFSFMMIEDSNTPVIKGFAKDIIPSDGHPMTNPNNRNWCICDTYPDERGDRELFLYNFTQDSRYNIGIYRRLFDKPDINLKELYLKDVDESILKTISVEQLSFTRSGLHCDLHPRWNSDGKWGVFDSIHNGTRQIYKINTSDIVEV